MPSRYAVPSWRWLLFDRVVTTRVAGTEPIDGVQPGGIIGYTPIEFMFGVKYYKFRRAHSLWTRATTVNMRCGCSRHFWRRKPWATAGKCELHGIAKLLNDLYRENPELKRVSVLDADTPHREDKK